jgi:small-conductance mechanosensitive channel
MDQIVEFFNTNIGTSLADLVIALLILLIGYIVARIIAGIIRRLLKRTNLDNRIADALSQPGEERRFEVEDIIAKVVFWLLMIFVFVAFFDRIGLAGISAPLGAFLDDLTTVYLPRLFAAGILLLIAWLVATVLRFLVRKAVTLTKLDERLSKYGALEEGEEVTFGEALSSGVFWLIFLLFLPAVLSALGISEIAEPLQNVFDEILGVIPDILAAVIVFFIGWFVARVVFQVLSNLLKAIGADKFGQNVGLSEEYSLSNLVARIVYIFILIVTVIAALDQLNIDAISEPTTQMLTTIVDAIPGIIGAALVLVISYVIAKLVSKLVEELLSSVGFDSVPEKLGFSWSVTNSPSKIVGYLVLVAIMLLAATSAAELLGSAFLVTALGVFIGFFWQVVLAVLIFAIGLYFASLAKNLIAKTGANQAGALARLAQIAIIVFAAAMALRELGLANDIINLAFGITLAALGLAAALAFGLGGREVAGRELDRFVTKMRSDESAEE